LVTGQSKESPDPGFRPEPFPIQVVNSTPFV
jgi:hypothetical protein